MVKSSRIQRYRLSIASGLMMALAFPYIGNLYFLMFFAWIPLLWIEDIVCRNSYRGSKIFLHAYITFFIYNLFTTWWVWHASIEGALMAFFANSLLMALVFYLFHLTKKYVGNKEGYISLLIYWIGFEYFHYHWELSWPWLNLGNIFSIQPEIVQWYNYLGVLGGTLWILILNLIAFRILQNIYFKKETLRVQTPLVYLFAIGLFVPIIASLITYFNYEEIKNPIEIVAVQPNIDPYNTKFTSPIEAQIKDILDLAEKTKTPKTKFVLAPETAMAASFYEEDLYRVNEYKDIIQRTTTWKNTSLLIGASTIKFFETKNSSASRKLKDGPGYIEDYNTSILFSGNEPAQFWHKSKLVLGVEKIPFTSSLPFLEELAINLDGTTGSLGVEKFPPIGKSQGTVFAPVICYESIYGEFVAEQCRKGAEIIFIITNDGWWKDTPGYKQHKSFARLRAVENRRSLARSANTGTSCFINQRGDIIEETEWWKVAAIRKTLNKNSEITNYSKYGDVLGRGFAFVAALLMIYTFVRYFRQRFMVKKA